MNGKRTGIEFFQTQTIEAMKPVVKLTDRKAWCRMQFECIAGQTAV
jgi:hypothetical protein